MEKKVFVGRAIETATMSDKRHIPEEFKHLSKSGIPQSARESYAKWRKERIAQLKRAERWGDELAELMRSEVNEKG